MREAHPSGPRLRWFIAARSRISEDALALAAGNGARQLVVLGAGLDTLAYRTPLAGRLRIFEVDHPATQAWKRELLAAGIDRGAGTLTFVAGQFRARDVGRCAGARGFRSGPAQLLQLARRGAVSDRAGDFIDAGFHRGAARRRRGGVRLCQPAGIDRVGRACRASGAGRPGGGGGRKLSKLFRNRAASVFQTRSARLSKHREIWTQEKLRRGSFRRPSIQPRARADTSCMRRRSDARGVSDFSAAQDAASVPALRTKSRG